jgi:hypothetical protein
MPLGSKRSRLAKEKRRHGRAVFAKRAASPDSDYYAPESSPDAVSTTEAESSDESEADDRAATPVEGLQRLYSVFLPPHLRLKEPTRQKRQKTTNRQSVYTKDSRTTAWRKNTAQRKAAEGCTTLDAFISRKVRLEFYQINYQASHCDQKRQHSFSSIEEVQIVRPPADLHAREIARSSADLHAGEIARPSTDLRAGVTARSSADLNAEVLMQSAADRVSLSPDEALAQSADDLAVPHSLERSVADLRPVSTIDDEINKITEELAAFCLDQLEKSAMPSDSVDSDLNANPFGDELQVRDYICDKDLKQSLNLIHNYNRSLPLNAPIQTSQGTRNSSRFHCKSQLLRPRVHYLSRRRTISPEASQR